MDMLLPLALGAGFFILSYWMMRLVVYLVARAFGFRPASAD